MPGAGTGAVISGMKTRDGIAPAMTAPEARYSASAIANQSVRSATNVGHRRDRPTGFNADRLGPYAARIARDAAFHAFVAAYAVAAILFGYAAGVPHKFAPFSYLAILAGPRLILAGLIGGGLLALRSPRPFEVLGSGIRRISDPETVAGLVLFASLSIHLGVFTSVKSMLTDVIPFFADPYLAAFDRLLHGKDPWLYGTVLMRPGITATLERFYFGIWGLLLPGSLLMVLVMPKLRHVRAQYVWVVLLSWPLLGNVIAGVLMSAGPAYYELVTGDTRFGLLTDYLARHSLAQGWQAYLWNTHLSGAVEAGTGISAFPSMHLANATLFVLLASRIDRWLMCAALAFAAVILLSSVLLGWHYAVDGYFAIAATVLIWKLVGWGLAAKPLHS
jgi:hypothetical protein